MIRDRLDNVVIICSIENIDPMGVHTGDSICVAPSMTLSDREYQTLRDAAAAVIRVVGVETGGSNVQFALNRETGELVVIEMNPRVSRSSALASKATGYPIAKVATRLAIGYTLDEIPNDITGTTPASFEPTIDYVVVKAPRFAFEKFPGADGTLTTQMKSVGEAMGIGRNFCEAMGKTLRSRELDGTARSEGDIRIPKWDRLDALLGRMRAGESAASVSAESGIHPWFCDEFARTVALEHDAACAGPRRLRPRGHAPAQAPRRLRLAASPRSRGSSEADVRARRRELGVQPVFKTVDSCGGEVVAETSYLYSSYDRVDEPLAPGGRRVLILGSGPNRIGQGIEFDYCCVQAVRAFQRAGCEAVMVNCNPETVSTDYDTSDRLYFEPLTVEDVLAIVEREQPLGVVAQFGGQTPLRLARTLVAEGVTILGTDPAAIDLAEDRERFGGLLDELGLRAPEWGIANDADEAVVVAERIGYPVLVRPSYVLGGRAMRVCYGPDDVRSLPVSPNSLVDRFLEDAIEVDVDAVSDGETVLIGGVMQHVEEAGDPLGRLRLRAAAALARTRSGGRDAPPDGRDRARSRRARPRQRAVRAARGHRLRDRGEPAREPHGAVRREGRRHRPGRARLPRRARRAPRRHRRDRARDDRRRRQGGGAAVRALPRRRPGARAGDALDRRGDGARARLPDRLREGVACGGHAAAVGAERGPARWPSCRSAIATSRP